MQKPYTDIFYLSYTGIIQTKKFHNAVHKRKLAESKTLISDSTRADGILESYSVDRTAKTKEKVQKTYKLNKSKVRKRAIAFSRLSKSKNNFFFYTISFPSQMPDNQCFEVFNICLTRLRKESMINDYLWITERQKNSTLHFHILTNDFFSVQTMNLFVRKSLINKVLRKEFDYDLSIIKKYNGVDIAKNRNSGKVTNFAKQKDNKLVINYLTKYITKNDIIFFRLPFHSSHSISKLSGTMQISDYEATMIFSEYDSTNTNPKTINGDFFTWYGFSNEVNQKAFEFLDLNNQCIYDKIPMPCYESKIKYECSYPKNIIENNIQLKLF